MATAVSFNSVVTGQCMVAN
ncbi:hypothetical protein YPPY61_3625, partial [Yersinia pestis PY-61]